MADCLEVLLRRRCQDWNE